MIPLYDGITKSLFLTINFCDNPYEITIFVPFDNHIVSVINSYDRFSIDWFVFI